MAADSFHARWICYDYNIAFNLGVLTENIFWLSPLLSLSQTCVTSAHHDAGAEADRKKVRFFLSDPREHILRDVNANDITVKTTGSLPSLVLLEIIVLKTLKDDSSLLQPTDLVKVRNHISDSKKVKMFCSMLV